MATTGPSSGEIARRGSCVSLASESCVLKTLFFDISEWMSRLSSRFRLQFVGRSHCSHSPQPGTENGTENEVNPEATKTGGIDEIALNKRGSDLPNGEKSPGVVVHRRELLLSRSELHSARDLSEVRIIGPAMRPWQNQDGSEIPIGGMGPSTPCQRITF
jgi:hypothetical protein